MQWTFQQPVLLADLKEFDSSCATAEQLAKLRWLDSQAAREFSAEGTVITDDMPFTEFFYWRRWAKEE
jgi:hypothetical protein